MKIQTLKLLVAAPFFATIAVIGLSVDTAFAATKTWTNGAGTDLWSDAGNWSPAGAPVDGDDLVFDDGDGGLFDIPTLSVSGIVFNGSAETNISDSTGNEILTLTGNVTSNKTKLTSVSNDVSLRIEHIVLGSDMTFTNIWSIGDSVPSSASTSLDLNSYTLSILPSNAYDTSNYKASFINNTISGDGAVVLNDQSVFMKDNNTYTGTTTLSSVSSNGHLGETGVGRFGASTVVATDSSLSLKPTGASWLFDTAITFNGQSHVRVQFDQANQQVAMPNLTLNDALRFDVDNYYPEDDASARVDLAGITANGNCIYYTDGSEDASAQFLNGPQVCSSTQTPTTDTNVDDDTPSPTAATVAKKKAPSVPDTGFKSLSLANPLVVLAAGILAVVGVRVALRLQRK